MKLTIKLFLLIIITTLLVNCSKNEVTSRIYPRLTTLNVTDLSENGAKFNAKIIFRGSFEVITYGFVWSEIKNPTIENSDRVVYAENIQSETFSTEITTTLKEGINYYVRSFIKTKDFTVYGENIKFLSLGSNGPTLIDFIPSEANLNDTIKIIGQNFGRYLSNIGVSFSFINAEIISFDKDTITVTVPNNLNLEKSTISVFVSENESTFEKEFTLPKPSINNITPLNGTIGSTVQINGDSFINDSAKINVYFRGAYKKNFEAKISTISKNAITVIVPQKIKDRQNKIIVTMNNFSVTSHDYFTIDDPVINSFAPEDVNTSTELIITGNNFSPIIENNEVLIDGYSAEILSATTTEISVKVPEQLNHIYSSRSVTLSVKVLGIIVNATNRLNITDKWLRLNDLPFNEYPFIETCYGMSVNNNGYVFVSKSGVLWEFDPETYSWVQKSSFPLGDRYDPAIFSIADHIYLGTGWSGNEGFNDFWEYNTLNDTWTQKKDFPGSKRKFATAFSIGDKGYLGTGSEYICSYCRNYKLSDFWQYNLVLDDWIQVASYPFKIQRASTTVVLDEAYVGMGTTGTQGSINNQIWKYNSTNNEWTRISDYPVHAQYGHYDAIALSVDNKAYFGSASNMDTFWEYNPETEIWSDQESNKAGRNGGFAFTINNIGYFGSGQIGSQFWLFDISQPD